MNERQLQFRVGMFVIVASVAGAAMLFQFSELKSILEPRYQLAIHFDSAPGVFLSTPVRRNGITIGKVSQIEFDENQGGVLVVVDIRREIRIRNDSNPRLIRSLLGDASIEFSPGRSQQFLAHGNKLKGQIPSDPMRIINRMEEKLTRTLDSFHETSQQWGQVAQSLNGVLDNNQENLQLVVARAAASLEQFTRTMQHADKILGNPQTQRSLQKTLAALPKMVDETHQTIAAVKNAIQKADENLDNLKNVTGPLAGRSTSIVNLESLTGELSDLAQMMAKKDGTVQKLVSDPELYQNLNRSAASMAVLLKNMEPIVHDLRIFSDKVARHPELIGVGGALKGSSGLKSPPAEGGGQQSRQNTERRRPTRR